MPNATDSKSTNSQRAQDLLEALRKIVSVYESGTGGCLDLRMSDIARAAIAKAEDQQAPVSAPSCGCQGDLHTCEQFKGVYVTRRER
jgi:hypothetical protein